MGQNVSCNRAISPDTVGIEHYKYINQLRATTNSIMIRISSIEVNKMFVQTLVEVKDRVWVCVTTSCIAGLE